MRTYAEYLNTMTVKDLNAIAKQAGLKGYSKLRKAELIIMLDNAIAELVPVILDTENIEDAPAIVKIMAEVAPITFSTPAESTSKPRNVATLTVTPIETVEDDTDDLIEAYRYMRKSRHTARGRVHVSLTNKLTKLHNILKARKVCMREL